MSLLAEQLAPLAAVTWRRRSVGASSQQQLRGSETCRRILLRARAGFDTEESNTELGRKPMWICEEEGAKTRVERESACN